MASDDIKDNRPGPLRRKDGPVKGMRILVTENIQGAAAATAANHSAIFFIADAPCEVVEVVERHETAGSDGGAVTEMLKKVPSGTAPASGTDVLAAGVNMKATANTNQTPGLHATLANRQLAKGDGLSLVTTGTLTALAGVSWAVRLKYI